MLKGISWVSSENKFVPVAMTSTFVYYDDILNAEKDSIVSMENKVYQAVPNEFGTMNLQKTIKQYSLKCLGAIDG